MAAKISSDMEKALKRWDKEEPDSLWQFSKDVDVSYPGLLTALQRTGRLVKNKRGILVRKNISSPA